MKTLNENLSKILTLVNEAGSIEGRTKFQKIVYILKNKGINFQEKFKYHYFGPYSPDLQLEIDELVDRNILIEKTLKPYIYELNQKYSFDKNLELSMKKDLINFLNNNDSKELELTSTIYFIEKNGITNNEIIKKKLAIFKPHLKCLIDKSFKLKSEIDNFGYSSI